MIIGSMRERDFSELFSAVKKIIYLYTLKKDESTWFNEANKFEFRLDQTIKASKSLITLCQETMKFAQSLVSKYTWAASFIVSSDNLKYAGFGSSLKKSLEEAVEGYKPYSFVYLVDEMRNTQGHFYYENARGRFRSAVMQEVSIDTTDYLSKDSLFVLHRAREDKKFRAQLRLECNQFGKEFNFDQIMCDYHDRVDGANKKKRTFSI